MNQDLVNAVSRLTEEYTCVVCRDDTFYYATERGVKPLLTWVEEAADMSGFSAADRVVGRGAAFLYRLLGVRAVYARVMSTPAARVLKEGGIEVHCGQEVPGIINRRGDGPCPFEAAVMHIDKPEEALRAIQEKMVQLRIR